MDTPTIPAQNEPASPVAAEAGHEPGTPWRALPVILVGVFLATLDFFIVNVALPSIQTQLHAAQGGLEWIVDGYGLMLAVALLASARIGDHLGRRGTYMLGIAVFVAASVLCALAPGMGVLIAARFLQGLGAALMLPNVLALIGVHFSGPARSRAVGVYGVVLGIAAALGQLIGGLLINADIAGSGWRSIFAINVPIGLAALILIPVLVPRSPRPSSASRLDVTGMVLMTATATAVILPLIEGRQAGWPAWTWALLASSPIFLAGTILQQRRLGRRGGSPLFAPALLSERTFRAGLLWQVVYWCGQASFFFVLVLYLQEGRHLTALEAGGFFAAMTVPFLLSSSRAPSLAARHGRHILIAGSLCLICAYGAFAAAIAQGPHATIALLMPALALAGVGQGLCIPTSTTLVLAHAKPEQAGAVSGALSTMEQVGNCLGVAVIGMLYFAVVPSGEGAAMFASLAGLTVVSLAVIAVTFLLPAVRRRP